MNELKGLKGLPGGPAVKIPSFHAAGVASIPSPGAKIHAGLVTKNPKYKTETIL